MTGTAAAKAWATATASWPVMASTTSSVSTGLTAAWTAGSRHQLLVDVRRPAVSRITTSRPGAWRPRRPRGRCRGRGVPRRAIDRHVELLPSVWSWSAAAGRYGSAATSSGRRPSLTSGGRAWPRSSSCPSPAGRPARRPPGCPSGGRSGRRPTGASTSSSWTILTTCWPAVRLSRTSRADGLLAHPGDEVLDDLEVDVRLEQREADLAHGGVDVGLGDPAAAGQAAEVLRSRS